MAYKITSIFIGLVIIAAVFGLFINAMINAKQNTPSLEFDNETMQEYNKMTTLAAQAESIKSKEENVTTNTGLLDILGDLLQRGYSALRTTKQTIDTVDSLTDQATKDVDLGSNTKLLVVLAGVLFTIIIILGILIKHLVKMDT